MDAAACLDTSTLAGLDGAVTSGSDLPSATRRASRRIVLITPRIVRAYVGHLATGLRQRGHLVRIEPTGVQATPPAVDWLLYFERLAYRSRSRWFDSAPIEKTPGFLGPADFLVDLAGEVDAHDVSTIQLRFREGGTGEIGLLCALLTSTAPMLDLVLATRGQGPRVLGSACLAVERPQVLAAAIDGTIPRLATLVVGAVEKLDRARIGDLPPVRSTAPTPAAAFAARGLAAKLLGRVTRLIGRADTWHIATRRISGDGVFERQNWSGPAWSVVPDDGQRYFADPVLFSHGGRRWLFCEEFPYATAKGILSVAPIDEAGTVGPMRSILETPGHLSWPQVFVHGGEVFMVPESAAAGAIQLWRATEFPYRWTLDRDLVSNIRAHDPVMHLTERGAFMLATLDGDGGSSWDALGLFHAPDLFGIWRAHEDNPLCVDASAARAAGPLIFHGNALWRATQDCRLGYGAGLALCRVTQLDEGGFRQDVVARLGAPGGTGAHGVHSLWRDGDLEAIDLYGPKGRIGRA